MLLFSDKKIEIIEKKIQYIFKNKNLLKQSLTHPSLEKNIYYDRLEFLGDRILSFVISTKVLNTFPEESIAQIVLRCNYLINTDTLAKIFISFGKELILSNLISNKVLANNCEALIGAIFLDGGLNNVKKFIYSNWELIMENQPKLNPKNQLQEWCHKRQLNLIYKEKKHDDEKKMFIIEVYIEKLQLKTEGIGGTKKCASQESAENMIKLLKKKNLFLSKII